MHNKSADFWLKLLLWRQLAACVVLSLDIWRWMARLVQSPHEKLAILAWCSYQCILCLDLAQRAQARRVLGYRHTRQLLVDPAGHRRILRGCLGTGLALALFIKTGQGDSDQHNVPGCSH